MSGQQWVAEAFAELSDTLVIDIDALDFLHLLTSRCVQLLDVRAASVMVADPDGVLRLMAVTPEYARLLALFECDAAPYTTSFATGQPVTADLATAGARWPQFTPRARDLGFRSVHAIPMRLRGEVVGVLTLYREQRGQLSDADARLGQALANVTTVGLLRHRTEVHRQVLTDQLQQVISTRIMIEQARGVLGERLRVDVDVALDELHRHSARTSRSLAQTAALILDGDHTADPILLVRAFDRTSVRPLRALLHRRLAVAGLPAMPTADFLFAVHEAVINAVIHGGDHGRLWLWRHAGSLWCEISDDGPGMPPGATTPAEPPDPHAESGRGVWLMHRICTSLDITASATGGARFLLRFPATASG